MENNQSTLTFATNIATPCGTGGPLGMSSIGSLRNGGSGPGGTPIPTGPGLITIGGGRGGRGCICGGGGPGIGGGKPCMGGGPPPSPPIAAGWLSRSNCFRHCSPS